MTLKKSFPNPFSWITGFIAGLSYNAQSAVSVLGGAAYMLLLTWLFTLMGSEPQFALLWALAVCILSLVAWAVATVLIERSKRT